MTELRRRGGGGEDPDSTDNISDKVKIEQKQKDKLNQQKSPRDEPKCSPATPRNLRRGTG